MVYLSWKRCYSHMADVQGNRVWINIWAHLLINVTWIYRCVTFLGHLPSWYHHSSTPVQEKYAFSYYSKKLRPCEAYIRQWTGSAFVQIMACRRIQTLPELLSTYRQFDCSHHISMTFFKSKFYSFFIIKCICKRLLLYSSHFILASMC